MSALTVTIIQTRLFWEDKVQNLKMLEEKISAITERTEIIVLPEMFSTGFSMRPSLLAEKMDGQTIQWMKKISSSKRAIITGSIIIEEEGNYYNRLLWMLPTGQYGTYDKRHLFAYAGEQEHYKGGGKRLIASVKGWRINLQVCYDLRFPVWARQSHMILPGETVTDAPGQETDVSGDDDMEAPEYDILIYVANWPERRIHAWKTLLQARAIENQSYVIGVNRVGNDGNEIYYSGDSMIVDPLGEILYSRSHDEDIFTMTIQQKKLEEIRARFPFWKDADNFILGV
jgi:omega-amidase